MSAHIDIFDPEIHLAPPSPVSTFTLADLGFSGSSVAGSNPFPFLSRAGVLAYRRSIFHPDLLNACSRPMGKGTLTLRNVTSQSKFVRDLWKHPKTMERVSEALGVEVGIIMEMEIGHTNIQMSGEGDMNFEYETGEPGVEKVEMSEEEKKYDPLKRESVIPWHFDSYPYVCIVMLSDTTHMHGGHTYIRRGDGAAQKVEGPSLGTAVVLQGGRVEHLASRAFGTTERITSITSYRVASPGVWDDSMISNVRPYDKLEQLYRQWSLYRLKKMKDEIQAAEDRIKGLGGDPFPKEDVEALCGSLAAYAQRTARQMIDPAIRNEVVAKFGLGRVAKVGSLWLRANLSPDSVARVEAATRQTLQLMPSMKSYMIDWHFANAKRSLEDTGAAQKSCSGVGEKNVLFPDELAKQGQNELLVCWLDKMGLLDLLGPAG